MMSRGYIRGVSLSHKEASIEDLEIIDRSERLVAEDLLESPEVEEAYILRTCHRVEAYVVTNNKVTGDQFLKDLFADVPDDLVSKMDHEESLRHLIRVAAGLESVILGEDQILGQVRDAYEEAQKIGAIGPILEDCVTKAIHVGKRARSETAINDGVVSLASAAVRLAEDNRDLTDATALVVGAGEMGQRAAQGFMTEVDQLLIANRNISHAEHVVESVDVDASAFALEGVPVAAEQADVIVSATSSPEAIFDVNVLADAGETFLVDIAQPRDVPPSANDLSNIDLRDLDSLEVITDATHRQRETAAEEVEKMVEAAVERLLAQYKRNRADSVISEIYENGERIKTSELEAALTKLDLNSEQIAIIESMADAIVSQILANPTISLRDAAEQDDWSTIYTALQLFDLSGEDNQTPGVETAANKISDNSVNEIRIDD